VQRRGPRRVLAAIAGELVVEPLQPVLLQAQQRVERADPELGDPLGRIASSSASPAWTPSTSSSPAAAAGIVAVANTTTAKPSPSASAPPNPNTERTPWRSTNSRWAGSSGLPTASAMNTTLLRGAASSATCAFARTGRIRWTRSSSFATTGIWRSAASPDSATTRCDSDVTSFHADSTPRLPASTMQRVSGDSSAPPAVWRTWAASSAGSSASARVRYARTSAAPGAISSHIKSTIAAAI
jgi:hypothetical protein